MNIKSPPKLPCTHCGSKNVQYSNKPMSEVTIFDKIFKTHKVFGKPPFFGTVIVYCSECNKESFIRVM